MASPISIIGMAGRFPGDLDVAGLWNACVDGTCLIDSEAQSGGRTEYEEPRTIRAAGRLARKAWFDHGLFGIPLGEARSISYEQRLFLSVCWEALMDAGIDRLERGDRVGVFAAGGTQDGSARHSAIGESTTAMLGREADYIALRTSYRLGLSGPSMCVSSACSSSLVAVHMACASLLRGECDVALAGGVNVLDSYEYDYVPGGIQSRDGYCRVFDAAASGTVFSEGAAVVALCREEDARTYDDRGYAVILGSGVNNDGSGKSGFTAPSIEGQVRVIEDALDSAAVSQDSVELIEAHGTATLLGDPVEIEALRVAYGTAASRRWLKSVKANIGHLGRAAGICGLIHATLSVWNKLVPRQTSYSEPNELLQLAESGFQVPTISDGWDQTNGSRRAAVSSFGFGGTNCHMIIEESASRSGTSPEPEKYPDVLLFSGASQDHATAQLREITEWLDQTKTSRTCVAKTLACGRSHEKFRGYVLSREDPKTCVSRISSIAAPRRLTLAISAAGTDHQAKSADRTANELPFAQAISDFVVTLSNLVGAVAIQVHVNDAKDTIAHIDLTPVFTRDGVEWSNEAGQIVRFTDVPDPDEEVEAFILANELQDARALHRLCAKIWQRGFDVRWRKLFAGVPTVSLPDQRPPAEVPLERATDPQDREVRDVVRTKDPDLRRWLYAPSWVRLSNAAIESSLKLTGLWVVLSSGDDPCRDHLVQALQQLQAKVVTVEDVVGESVMIETNPAAPDYVTLLERIRDSYDTAAGIHFVHTWATSDLGDYPVDLGDRVHHFEHAQERGFYDLLAFGKALKEVNWTNDAIVIALGTGLSDFHSKESIEPDKTTIFGPLRVIPQELPQIACLGIDLPRSMDLGIDTVRLICAISQAREHSLVAIDSAGRLWSQTYDRIATPPAKSRLRTNGVYLITGGLGGIGMTLAEYLAEEVAATLILTGISEFPPRDRWEQRLAELGSEDDIGEKIRRIRLMETSGAKVVVAQCDASDAVQTGALIQSIVDQFGTLNGVIHAAGIFETQRAFRGIDETERVDCERRFLPKVHGTLVLAEALRGMRLDFCLMQSSLSSMLGGIGFVAYTAGNVFMDAFADRHRTDTGIPWMSVNWDGWIFRDPSDEVVGQSVIDPGFASTSFGVVSDLAIRPAEGAAVLDRLLKWGGLEQVAVSPADLAARLEQWIALAPVRQSRDTPETYERSHGLDAFLDIVAGLLETTVTADDNFFAVGGDSLIGVELVSKIGDRFGVVPSIVDLFEHPRIGDMYQVVQQVDDEGNRG